MPLAVLLTEKVTSVEKPNQARLTHRVLAINSRADVLKFALAVVTTLQDLAGAFRMIGARLEMDKGDGALSTVTKDEIAANINLHGSIAGYGSRELTFSRFGLDQSPFRSSLLRGSRAIKLTGYRGTPGNVGGRPMFEGNLRTADFSGYPPVASIEAQDTSIQFVDRRLFYTLAAGAGKTRREVLLDVCAANGIPVGSIELVIDGGIVYKAISEGGDRGVLDWIREFLVPTGARMFWRDGKLNVRRFGLFPRVSGDAAIPVSSVRTLKSGDIKSIKVIPPSTTAPNKEQFSASIFSYIGPAGQRTTVETTSARGTYAPLVATKKQSKIDGTISNLSLSSSAVDREISRVITTTTYDGGTMISQTVEEWGWYAARACNKRQTGAGAITFNNQFDVFQYSDDSWRVSAQEDFQVVRRQTISRIATSDGYISAVNTTHYGFAPSEIAYATIPQNGNGSEVPNDVLVNDDGVAWLNGQEQFISEIEALQYAWNADTLKLTGGTGGLYTSVPQFQFQAPVIGNPYTGATLSVFGPRTAKRYGTPMASASYGYWFGYNITLQYVPIDEQSHRRVRGYSLLVTTVPGPKILVPASESVTVAGAVPSVEQLTAQQGAQAATSSVTDDVRVALVGRTITDYRENNFCETDGELRTAAIEALRDISSPRVEIETEIDWIIEEGAVITVNHPSLTYGDVRLLVEDVAWNLNGATAENTQILRCRWDTPELVAN